MNVLGNVTRLKCVSNIVINNITQVTRNYAAFNKLPVEWIQPRKRSCISKEVSGDGGLEFNITKDKFIEAVDPIASELDNAPDLVKKMLSVDFHRRKELVKIQRERAKDLVRRHQYDETSIECRIAFYTAQILQLQDQQVIHEKNSKSKVLLKETIEKRKKYLKRLRIYDVKRFEFLLERLNLVYHPYPEETTFLTRKNGIRKVLQNYCDDIVQKKLDAYKAELQDQQKDYYREKVEKLEFIRNEEIACGVAPTITLEEIEAAKQKAATFAQ